MAGSFNHVIDKEDGSLRQPNDLLEMLDCHHGDVYEAIEEMYGMIWYLAGQLDVAYSSLGPGTPDELIDAARTNYKLGLMISPTKRFKGK